MQYRFAILILLVIAMTGCTTASVQQSSLIPHDDMVGAIMAPELGILTDLDLRVTALQPRSVAEQSDIQVGDVLVDVRWAREAMPEADTSAMGANAEGTPTNNGEVITEPVLMPAATLSPDDYVEKEAIPFTELDRVVSLIGYGFPLELRLLRDGKEITIQITPGPRLEPLLERPKRTNPEEHAYYYY